MFVGFALFEAVDDDGRVESFLIFPTDTPHVVADRIADLRGMPGSQQADIGPLRFYVEDGGLRIQRLVGQYGPSVFARSPRGIELRIEHHAMPIAEHTVGYYSLLLPTGFSGHVHTSFQRSHTRWLEDTSRLLISGEILDARGHLTKDLEAWAQLHPGEPDSHVRRIRSTEVYADWTDGPHHNNVRSFIRAANAGLSDTATGLFICHSSEDKAFARRLAVALAGSGFKVWIDEAEIRIGDSLIGKIEAGITDATHLVAIMSNASVDSRWCQEELRMALSRQIAGRNISVLPVLLEHCELPGFLQEKKYADFRDQGSFDQSVSDLVAAIT